MHPLIQMNRITKSFSGVIALNEAALEITPGEVHALIGQNGAGKSTLIKILTGVYTKDGGDVTIDNQQLTITGPRDAQKHGIATIYQELNLVPLRTVTENIVLGYEPRGFGGLIDWKAAHKKSREILNGFGLNIDVTQALGSYSTAIQQLVAIARAVSLNAKLVIMDEPTSSLDDKEVDMLFGVVRSLKAAGVSVLYVSHFLDELFAICDRVTIMRDGQTVDVKTIAESTKLELIASMLGRDAAEIEAAGSTELGGGENTLGEVLFEAENLSTSQHLHASSLSVRRGEIVGLGGLLGSGRTETGRAIFGMDRLKNGNMTFKGAAFNPTKARDSINLGIGFLTEDRKIEGIIPDMSVRENLTLAILPSLTVNGQIDRKKEKEIVQYYVDALGIKIAHMDQPIKELSGGNQQKVLLARWLAIKPDFLILDEPTRGVDVGAKFEIQAIIREYVDSGGGLLLISSEFDELVEGADRIVVMQDGKSVTELKNPGITEQTLVKAIAHSHDTPQTAPEAA